MYRLLGDNHTLSGFPYSAQVFIRALDSVRSQLAADMGVTGIELRALSFVAESSGLGITALGNSLELPAPAMGVVIDGLVARELMSVVRGDLDPLDPTLRLTPSGHTLMTTMYNDFQQSINAAASTLDEDRRWGLESGMLKMARKLDDKFAHRP